MTQTIDTRTGLIVEKQYTQLKSDAIWNAFKSSNVLCDIILKLDTEYIREIVRDELLKLQNDNIHDFSQKLF